MIIEFVRSKKVEKTGFVRGWRLGGPDGEWQFLYASTAILTTLFLNFHFR